MTIRLHNDLHDAKEPFEPQQPGRITMYVCGPTVYGPPHIGNWRTFVTFDVVRRYFLYRGYQVTYVQNVTDIDDKMIRRAQERGITVPELAAEYTAVFQQGMRDLNVLPPDIMPAATGHIAEIILLIHKLMEKGLAYEVEGDVYFSIGSYPHYGQLTHQSLEEMQAGARVEVDERKRHPMDFALWKAQKPGEPAWDSPWGPGRPGWHIECSAMAMKYLGDTVDIHAGGIDLLFPHHENEIAQSQGATGHPLARYWMHSAFLTFDGEKMSKSLGNVRDLDQLKQRYDPEVLRFFYLSAHYRTPLNFSEEQLQAAQAGLERLYNTLRLLRTAQAPATPEVAAAEQAFRPRLEQYRQRFIEAMDDDFNTGAALAAVFDLTRDVNPLLSAGVTPPFAQEVLRLYQEWGGVLGILQRAEPTEDALDAEIQALVEQRQAARKVKNWAEADRIRDELAARGILLEDTPQGVRWRRK